jgi:hypothetical protein
MIELKDEVNSLRIDKTALSKNNNALAIENNWLRKSMSDLHATLYETTVATVAVFGLLVQESLQVKAEHGIVVSKLVDENFELLNSKTTLTTTLEETCAKAELLADANALLQQQVVDVTNQAREKVEQAIKPYWWAVVSLLTLLCSACAYMWHSRAVVKPVVKKTSVLADAETNTMPVVVVAAAAADGSGVVREEQQHDFDGSLSDSYDDDNDDSSSVVPATPAAFGGPAYDNFIALGKALINKSYIAVDFPDFAAELEQM